MDAADEWWTFEDRLTRYLAAMPDDEVLILTDSNDDSRYVQFMSFGSNGIHGEAAMGASDDELVRGGWQPPEVNWRGKPVGSPNLTVDVPPQDVQRLSAMVVTVLRDVWEIDSPNAVTAEKLEDFSGPPVTDLGIPAR